MAAAGGARGVLGGAGEAGTEGARGGAVESSGSGARGAPGCSRSPGRVGQPGGARRAFLRQRATATAATAVSVTASLRLLWDGPAGLLIPSCSGLRNSMTLTRPHPGSFPRPVSVPQQQLSMSPDNSGRCCVPLPVTPQHRGASPAAPPALVGPRPPEHRRDVPLWNSVTQRGPVPWGEPVPPWDHTCHWALVPQSASVPWVAPVP